MSSVQRIMQSFSCSEEDAIRYLNLREEGYSSYRAKLMAGIADPPDIYEEAFAETEKCMQKEPEQ